MEINRIIYIPIERLEHHPQNPRGDLGDLTELTASIKESGIMQNLTVVPTDNRNGTYWVVIGNRRLEASKAAGIEELPCIISDMDHKTQLATMLAENMQRADLTLLEQAQGVQMMLDLGMETSDVAKRTGLRKSAVERRRAMMQYNPEAVEKAVARGGSLMDFADLEKIKDDKTRETLLAEIGTPNYRNRLRGALEDQRDWEIVGELVKKLEGFATRIDQVGKVGSREQRMVLCKTWCRPKMADVEAYSAPDNVADRRYYYAVGAYPAATLFIAVDSDAQLEQDKMAARTELDVKREAAQERMRIADEACARHKQLRYDFLDHGAELKLDKDYLISELLCLMAEGNIRQAGREDSIRMCELLQVETINKTTYQAHPEPRAMWEIAEKRQAFAAAAILMRILDGTYSARPCTRYYVPELSCCVPRHKEAADLRRWYRILEHIGYVMSDEEREMMDGTHACYREE